MTPSDQLRPGAEAIGALLANLTPDQLGAATPCADWDVRGLLDHIVGGAHLFAAAFAGQAPAGGAHDAGAPDDLVGDDPAGAWQRAAEAFAAGIDAPGALERMIPMPWGPTPGAVVFEILTFDILVHAWDLARATGQPFDPPAAFVEPALDTARGMIAPEMRDGVTFAAEVTAPDGATPIERLAAFTGRTV
jgi:uncharacterized protein (TIGR03086 family)